MEFFWWKHEGTNQHNVSCGHSEVVSKDTENLAMDYLIYWLCDITGYFDWNVVAYFNHNRLHFEP